MKRQTVSRINCWIAAAVAVFSLEIISSTWAIPITNPGFETDATPDLINPGTPYRANVTSDPPHFFNPVATGWTLLFPTTATYDSRLAVIQDLYGTYLNHNPDGSVSTTADDNNLFGMQPDNRISQQLGATFGPNVDYTLSVQAARLNPVSQSLFSGGRLILGYGTATSFTTLAVVTNVDNSAGLDTLPDAAPGEWTTILLNYTTGATGPELGQNIVIAFQGITLSGSPSTIIDNFVLIPEPSAVALVCGSLILLWRRRTH